MRFLSVLVCVCVCHTRARLCDFLCSFVWSFVYCAYKHKKKTTIIFILLIYFLAFREHRSSVTYRCRMGVCVVWFEYIACKTMVIWVLSKDTQKLRNANEQEAHIKSKTREEEEEEKDERKIERKERANKQNQNQSNTIIIIKITLPHNKSPFYCLVVGTYRSFVCSFIHIAASTATAKERRKWKRRRIGGWISVQMDIWLLYLCCEFDCCYSHRNVRTRTIRSSYIFK